MWKSGCLTRNYLDDLVVFGADNGAGRVDEDAAGFDESGGFFYHFGLNPGEVCRYPQLIFASGGRSFCRLCPNRSRGDEEDAVEWSAGEVEHVTGDGGDNFDAEAQGVVDEDLEAGVGLIDSGERALCCACG